MSKTPSWEALLAEFLLHLKAAGRAKRTLDDYTYQVKRFFRAHPDAWPDRLKEACLAYFGALADESVAPTTYNLARQNLRAFFNWCVEEGILEASPIGKLPKRRQEPKIRYIEEEVIRELLAVIAQDTFAGLRSYALILLQLDTGVRPGEALQLLPEHFDFSQHQVLIPATAAKTRFSRVLPIYIETEKAVKRLLKARHPSWPPTTPVFCSFSGRPLSVDDWGHILKEDSKKIGRRIRPYDLRHTFAIMFLRNGGNVFALQQMLGHTTLAMTQYYVSLAERDIKDQHQLASPIARLLPRVHRVNRLSR